jgi:hypothetical protein
MTGGAVIVTGGTHGAPIVTAATPRGALCRDQSHGRAVATPPCRSSPPLVLCPLQGRKGVLSSALSGRLISIRWFSFCAAPVRLPSPSPRGDGWPHRCGQQYESHLNIQRLHYILNIHGFITSSQHSNGPSDACECDGRIADRGPGGVAE